LRLSFILVLLLFAGAVETTPKAVAAQSSSPPEAWNKLVQAYSILQDAEARGVLQADMIQFSSELNTALRYYENASRLLSEKNSTGAEDYSRISINISSSVSSKAVNLENNAQSQLLLKKEFAYAVAFGLAPVSAYLIVEFQGIRRFWRRRKTESSLVGAKP
jgi:hypothetical protein